MPAEDRLTNDLPRPARRFAVFLLLALTGALAVLGAALQSHYPEVVSLGNAGEALTQLARTDSPALVAADLIVPRADGAGVLGGLEILEATRRRHPATPVVLFSDYDHAEARARAAALGVVALLRKPPGPGAFVPGTQRVT